MPADLVLLTGADEKFFWQYLLLSESFRRTSPGGTLYVCDFGLSPAQRRFLRGNGVLLDMPADAGVQRHPWHYKAMLGRYVAPLAARAVLWIDVDMVMLADMAVLAGQLCASMAADGKKLAAPTDAVGSLAAWFAANQAPGFFARAGQIDHAMPYLSSGIFLCRAPALLAEWDRDCAAMPYEMLFEQNAFNLTAWRQPDSVALLNPAIWNVCGQDVARAQCSLRGETLHVHNAAGRAHVLHATSTDRQADILAIDHRMRGPGGEIALPYRIIKDPPVLRAYQSALFEHALDRNRVALRATGCLDAA